jgi:hypothetical protein
MYTRVRFYICPVFLILVLFGAPPIAQADISPIYTHFFDDCVTGTNSFTAQEDGEEYWTIHPGCDSYQNELL